jgi:hypothetical protein
LRASCGFDGNDVDQRVVSHQVIDVETVDGRITMWRNEFHPLAQIDTGSSWTRERAMFIAKPEHVLVGVILIRAVIGPPAYTTES